MAVAWLSGFVSSFANSSIVVGLPTIGLEFGASTVALNWLVTGFTLSTAAVLIPSGRAADIYGRKRLFLIGLGLSALTAAAAGCTFAFGWLLACRIVQGVASALLATTSTAIIVSAFPPEKRGQALGINVAAIYVGLSAGPVVGGFLIHGLGWRSLFWLVAGCSAVLIPLTLRALPGEWREAKGERLDLRGALLYGAGLTVLMVGLSWLPSWGGLALAAAGLAALAWFVWGENAAASPMLDVRLFRTNRVFALSNLAAMISYCGTFATSFFLSLYLQNVRGMDPRQAGSVLLVQPLLQALLSPLMGRFSDKVEPRLLSSAGMGLTVVGLFILGCLGADTPLAWPVAALAVLGVGLALFSSPNTNAIMGSVDKRQLGVASATVSTMRTVGQVLSMAIALLVTTLMGGQLTPGDRAPAHEAAFDASMRLAFYIAAGLSFAGMFASLARGTVHRGKAGPGQIE